MWNVRCISLFYFISKLNEVRALQVFHRLCFVALYFLNLHRSDICKLINLHFHPDWPYPVYLTGLHS
ncbi:unnamed protein product, partial [Brassica oleracea]